MIYHKVLFFNLHFFKKNLIKLVFGVLKEILVGNKETRDILSGVTEVGLFDITINIR